MNVEKMTERVGEALNAAYTRALTEHNTQTTPEHMLAAMLDQERLDFVDIATTMASHRPLAELAAARGIEEALFGAESIEILT